jgi:hypothetical protein
MTTQSLKETTDVYLEVGQKKVFAAAVDWPGWSRSGRDRDSALQALVDFSSRYETILEKTGLGFMTPTSTDSLNVVEELAGNATTDFGAPDAIPQCDLRPFDEEALERSRAILEAIWQTFDRIAESAHGRELRKGPRGGGRDLEGITRHVIEADASYLGRVGQKRPSVEDPDTPAQLAAIRQGILEALAIGVAGELPERGPRGGEIWPVRYFIRRVAWHALDHAWEIEDREV